MLIGGADNRATTNAERLVRPATHAWPFAALKVNANELQLALLFGKYHEQQAVALMQEGAPPHVALDVATREHLTRLATRIAIPRFLATHIGQLMSVQPKFLVLKDSNAARLKHRGCYHDAFVYFKLNSRFSARHHDEVKWWEEHRST